MSTGTPVVVSRIQNRRGLQQDFNNLYPAKTSEDPVDWPTGQPGVGVNVLQPGELAVCTDTGNVYIGTSQGYYTSVGAGSGSGGGSSSNGVLTPILSMLLPSPTWEPMLPPITITPFFKLIYSVTDVPEANVTLSGANFAKNGDLLVTSTALGATSVDTGVEVNSTIYDISFAAELVDGSIQLMYIHNFPAALTFSTSSVIWSPI